MASIKEVIIAEKRNIQEHEQAKQQIELKLESSLQHLNKCCRESDQAEIFLADALRDYKRVEKELGLQETFKQRAQRVFDLATAEKERVNLALKQAQGNVSPEEMQSFKQAVAAAAAAQAKATYELRQATEKQRGIVREYTEKLVIYCDINYNSRFKLLIYIEAGTQYGLLQKKLTIVKKKLEDLRESFEKKWKSLGTLACKVKIQQKAEVQKPQSSKLEIAGAAILTMAALDKKKRSADEDRASSVSKTIKSIRN